jgi:hypothetical protein
MEDIKGRLGAIFRQRLSEIEQLIGRPFPIDGRTVNEGEFLTPKKVEHIDRKDALKADFTHYVGIPLDSMRYAEDQIAMKPKDEAEVKELFHKEDSRLVRYLNILKRNKVLLNQELEPREGEAPHATLENHIRQLQMYEVFKEQHQNRKDSLNSAILHALRANYETAKDQARAISHIARSEYATKVNGHLGTILMYQNLLENDDVNWDKKIKFKVMGNYHELYSYLGKVKSDAAFREQQTQVIDPVQMDAIKFVEERKLAHA